MIYSKQIYSFLTIVSLLTAGCASHEHKFSATDSAKMVSGILIHGGVASQDRLSIEISGKQFEGELSIKKQLNWEKIHRIYGSDSRHWARISSGLDKDHDVSVGTANVTSTDGEMMECILVWTNSDRPGGECINRAGESLSLQLKYK